MDLYPRHWGRGPLGRPVLPAGRESEDLRDGDEDLRPGNSQNLSELKRAQLSLGQRLHVPSGTTPSAELPPHPTEASLPPALLHSRPATRGCLHLQVGMLRHCKGITSPKPSVNFSKLISKSSRIFSGTE